MKELTKDQFAKALTIAKFRVKIRSLAEEARIIRHEAWKRKGQVKFDVWSGYQSVCSLSDALRSHNVNVVRPEQRHTLLAYAFYRSVPYASVERCAESNKPSIDRITRILKSLSGKDLREGVSQWISDLSTDRKTA